MGVNILKSIDEGPFQMGTFRETLAEWHKSALHLGPERPRVYSDLSPKEKERGQGNNAQGAGAAGYGGAQNRVGNGNSGQARQIKCYNCNSIGHIENGVTLDEEHLLFIADGQDNAVDEDADEQPAPIAHTMFMENLSSADPVYDETGLSYDSNILSEVYDHGHYHDAVCEHHEYVKDNAVPVVQSNVSSVSNDAYVMILNDMHEQPTQHVFETIQNSVVDKSLTAKLATYIEQVELSDGNDKVIMWYQEPRFGLEFCLVDSKMIPEPGDANREITVTETFHLQTDDELSDKELKQIEADD
nr:hypothetical protein [Tanacetum cinerariifolium]